MKIKNGYIVYNDLNEDGRWFYGLYETLERATEVIHQLASEARICNSNEVVDLNIQNLPKYIWEA